MIPHHHIGVAFKNVVPIGQHIPCAADKRHFFLLIPIAEAAVGQMHDHLFQFIGAVGTICKQRFHQRFVGYADQERNAIIQMLDNVEHFAIFLRRAGNKDKAAVLRGLPAHIRIENALQFFFTSRQKKVVAIVGCAVGKAGMGRVNDELVKIHRAGQHNADAVVKLAADGGADAFHIANPLNARVCDVSRETHVDFLRRSGRKPVKAVQRSRQIADKSLRPSKKLIEILGILLQQLITFGLVALLVLLPAQIEHQHAGGLDDAEA